jgi:hypothetical protein
MLDCPHHHHTARTRIAERVVVPEMDTDMAGKPVESVGRQFRPCARFATPTLSRQVIFAIARP